MLFCAGGTFDNKAIDMANRLCSVAERAGEVGAGVEMGEGDAMMAIEGLGLVKDAAPCVTDGRLDSTRLFCRRPVKRGQLTLLFWQLRQAAPGVASHFLPIRKQRVQAVSPGCILMSLAGVNFLTS